MVICTDLSKFVVVSALASLFVFSLIAVAFIWGASFIAAIKRIKR